MSDILKRIRILVDTSSPRSILEQISGQIPRFFSGNDIRFEMSFTNNGVLLDANEIDQVHVEVKDFVNGQPPLPSDPALMSKFTTTLDDTSTLEDFVDGTGQQCVIEFTNAETSISAGSKFLVVWVTSSASPATILTVSTGTIRVDQSGSGPGQPAPDPIEQLLTVSVANASYLRLDATNLGSSALAEILDDKADLVAGKVPLDQLPALVATSSIEVADSAARLALTEEQAQGKIVVQADNGHSYMLIEGGDPSEAGDWVQIGDRDIGSADITDSGATGRALLQSADAATAKGHLSLVKGDVGLGNVDNTSDAAKPVSTAQQAALDLKADNSVASVSNAMILRGTGQAVIADAPTLRPGLSSMTVAFWLKMENPATSNGVICKGSPVSSYGQDREWAIGTGGFVDIITYRETESGSSVWSFSASAGIDREQWNHYVFVRDRENDEARWYVNGILTNTSASPAFIDLDGPRPISIGARTLGTNLVTGPRQNGDYGPIQILSHALTDAEVTELFRTGLPFRYRKGAFTPETSGTLELGQAYEIVDYKAGDSFTNVGAASNATGVIFTATGTTPTTWTNGSEVKRLGAVINLSADTIGMGPGQWRDASGNGHNGLIHTEGAYSLKRLDTDVLTIPNVTITSSGVFLLRAGAILPADMDVRDIAVNITDAGSNPDVTLSYDTGSATVSLATFSSVAAGRLISTPTVARPSAAHNRISAITTSGNVVADITLYLKRR